jgi:hypothetical protein
MRVRGIRTLPLRLNRTAIQHVARLSRHRWIVRWLLRTLLTRVEKGHACAAEVRAQMALKQIAAALGTVGALVPAFAWSQAHSLLLCILVKGFVRGLRIRLSCTAYPAPEKRPPSPGYISVYSAPTVA